MFHIFLIVKIIKKIYISTHGVWFKHQFFKSKIILVILQHAQKNSKGSLFYMGTVDIWYKVTNGKLDYYTILAKKSYNTKRIYYLNKY